MDSIVLKESSVLDPCYEIRK